MPAITKGDEALLAGVAIALACVLAIAILVILLLMVLKKVGLLGKSASGSRQTYEVAEEEVKIDLKRDSRA